MFEIIKLVISLFGKLLDPAELKSLMKSHHNEDLGAKLFMLYTVLDDIAIDGEALVGKLESYANEMDRRSKSEKDNWSLCGIGGYADISSNSRKQRENLQRLVHHSRGLQTELHLINPKAYRVFTLLVSDSKSGKATLVERLDRTLEQYKNDRLPLRVPPAAKLLEVADELARLLPTEGSGSSTGANYLYGPLLIRLEQLNSEFDAGSAAVDTTLWSEENFNEIRSYLENSKPREQLAEIRASAEDLRKSIEAVFPLSDILWKVGSKSFRDKHGYDR